MRKKSLKITVLQPHGYCAGVNRAISLALDVKAKHPDEPVYVIGMLVHNAGVIAYLKEKGIDMTFDISKLPKGSVVIFTAHGHPKKYDNIAKRRHFIVYDAVCPLVKKNIKLISEELKSGHQVIYIGYGVHPESLAATSLSKDVILYDVKKPFKYEKISDIAPFVMNQTTLNYLSLKTFHDDILTHFPLARLAHEICFATRKRQEALLNIPSDTDLIFIVGDPHSSNATRLKEIAEIAHPDIPSFMVENAGQVTNEMLKNKKHVVISSGASTPFGLVTDLINYLKTLR